MELIAASTRETVLDLPGVGLLHGLQQGPNGLRVFAGVPYAQPPLGDLRWRPPRRLAWSKGNVDATAFGAACPQEVSDGSVLGDEDCLTLNIFAPAVKSASDPSMPVLVWFHGGGYVMGTASVDLNGTWGPLYSGEALAAQGVIVVTVQYRLGALGFLGSSELRKRDVSGSTGNYGVQDQRLALQWVREYASSFGGDPNRVLIFGQSAGAGSVNFHLVANASRGLFHAAALQSGACAWWTSQSWQDSVATFSALRLAVNCSSMACLLRKSARELALAAVDVGARGFGFAPTEDGIELDRPICAKMERGEFSKVPLIVGFNRDESSPPSSARITEADFDEIISSQVPLHLQAEVKAKYTERYSEWYWAAQHFTADVDFNCPAQRFARAAESFGATVFAYKFSRQPNFNIELMMGSEAAPSELWGAFHGAELPFVFGNPRVNTWRINLSEADQQMARTISEHWVTMATKGRPSPTWPAFTSSRSPSRQWFLLDSPTVSVHEAELFSHCGVIDSLGPSPQTSANTQVFGRSFFEYGVAHIRGRAANRQRPLLETNSLSA